jgi:ATP phosphoribosyltransferase regulatory subunit
MMTGKYSATPGDERWLLPDGVEELLPEQAAMVEAMRRQLLDLYHRWGYELVIPPLIEYTESLLIGLGKDLDLQTFKLTDQLSGRLLGVRPDITPQAARIDSHSLRSDGPVRLCYAGSVLHTRPRSPFASRSPIQVGAELYGAPSIEADIEIVCLMLETLERVGIRGVTLDLGHVGIFGALMDQAALDAQDREALFEALQNKSGSVIADILAQSGLDAARASLLAQLARLNGGIDVLDEADQLFQAAGREVSEALGTLRRVAEGVSVRMPQVRLHFDLCELHGYHYHTGLVFAAYVTGHGEAVANGGRYDDIGRVFGRARPATGFNTDLKTLLNLQGTDTAPENGRGVFVANALADAAWEEVVRLRESGERVVVGMPGQAGVSSCDRELVRDGRGWRIHDLS